jgi:hypothetical protein
VSPAPPASSSSSVPSASPAPPAPLAPPVAAQNPRKRRKRGKKVKDEVKKGKEEGDGDGAKGLHPDLLERRTVEERFMASVLKKKLGIKSAPVEGATTKRCARRAKRRLLQKQIKSKPEEKTSQFLSAIVVTNPVALLSQRRSVKHFSFVPDAPLINGDELTYHSNERHNICVPRIVGVSMYDLDFSLDLDFE